MNKILVTGIGGNVGYGILRNLRHTYENIFIVGTNTAFISPGNHMCDQVCEIPFATDVSYIPTIKKICDRYEIQLIIPSTDYENYQLALHLSELPTVATSPASTLKIFLDKYLSFQTLSKNRIPFAESILPSQYNNEFKECIVKPREGRGSRGLHINPANINFFSDDYIVQPLLKGMEITTAFYVTKQNELYGLITLSRELSAGATSSCEVITDFDIELEAIIKKLISSIEIKGSCNLQCIVTDEGEIVPFEVNCRISGTNSIRSQFGFKDVAYTIDEFLFNKPLTEKPRITKGSAIRIYYDIIYPEQKLEEVQNKNNHFYIYG